MQIWLENCVSFFQTKEQGEQKSKDKFLQCIMVLIVKV